MKSTIFQVCFNLNLPNFSVVNLHSVLNLLCTMLLCPPLNIYFSMFSILRNVLVSPPLPDDAIAFVVRCVAKL